MKKGHLLLLFVTMTLVFASCTKHGPEGPRGNTGGQGPKGTAGTDGEDGANGADGTNGTNGADGAAGEAGAQGPAGTANVIYSNWFTNDEFSLPWADSSVTSPVLDGPEVISRAIKNAPDITSGILDSGIVLSYMRNASLISPQLLPWIFSFTDADSGDLMYCQLNVAPKVGGILYYVSNQTTHNASGISPNSGYEFRYIIIPGGVLAGGRKIDPKTMSYSEICKTYHIPQ